MLATVLIGGLLAISGFVFLCTGMALTDRNLRIFPMWLSFVLSGAVAASCGYYFLPSGTQAEEVLIPDRQVEPVEPDISRSEMDEVIATMLNLGGHLCARVVSVTPLRLKDTYEVTCIEYRGGNGRVTYIFEATSGNAFRQ